MNRNDELRMVVQKIVHGNHRSDHIDRLLLGLRSKLRIGSKLRDVADFIAHPDQRDRGPLHKHVARIKFSQDLMFEMQDPDYVIKRNDLIKLVTDRHLIDTMGLARENFDLTQREIDRQVLLIKSQLAVTDAKKIDDAVSTNLFPLLDFYISHHMWSTVYYDSEIIDELIYSLIHENILKIDDKFQFLKFKYDFVLHICYRLHLTEINIDGTVFTLYVGRELKYHHTFGCEMPHLTVWATHGKTLQYAICLFSTEILTFGVFDDVAMMLCNLSGFVWLPVDFDGRRIYVQAYA